MKLTITPLTTENQFGILFKKGVLIADYFRIMHIRRIGKISFFTLNKDLIFFQALFSSNISSIKFNRGNIVYIEGVVIHNQKGLEILEINQIELIEEGLEITDSNYYKLNNVAEIRRNTIYRLFQMKKSIIERSFIYDSLRSLLKSKNYIETICPIISNEYGGANATSFTTSRRKQQYYLSICPELYLKRYLLSGLSRVYSIHRSFRNEGFDNTHYPEFDMIELYEVGSSARRMKDLFFEFIRSVSERYQISFQYKTIDYFSDPTFTMKRYEEELNINKGWLVVEGLPHSESPLCKEGSPGISDQIEIYYNNLEVANIYTEETNCKKLRLSFQKSKSDTSSKEVFLEDFSYEIPPTGGMGFGLDRLVMILLKKEKLQEILPFINNNF